MPEGRPRFDKVVSLMGRFYEPLYLLSLLRQAAGPRTQIHHDTNSEAAIRRRFLQNLSFICDYEKGGRTTTALAIESRSDCYVYWIAMNKQPAQDVTTFLHDILKSLGAAVQRSISDDHRVQIEHDLTARCIQFAQRRVKKEAQNLARACKKSREMLTDSSVPYAQTIIDWLCSFNYEKDTDLVNLCRRTYDARHGPEMDNLQALSREQASAGGNTPNQFKLARHYLGRLAQHVRAVRDLMTDAGVFPEDLFNVFQVSLLPMPTPEPRPPTDGHTHLDGILRRMVSDEARRAEVRHALDLLNLQHFDRNLEMRIREEFANPKQGVQVHAEVQVLHHFHREHLEFAFEAPLIACSKPACYCCKLYFQHHPACPESPDTHDTIVPTWGLPRLPDDERDPKGTSFIARRDLINNMNADVRKLAIQTILDTARPASHPASFTAITDRSRDGDSDFYDSDDVSGGFDADDDLTIFSDSISPEDEMIIDREKKAEGHNITSTFEEAPPQVDATMTSDNPDQDSRDSDEGVPL